MGLARGLTLHNPASMHRSLLHLRALARRLLLSALPAAALIGIAYSGMFVAMAPRFISEFVEPLSLLLLPGLLFAIASVGPHDFQPETVLKASALFWFLAAFLFFTWRARASRRSM